MIRAHSARFAALLFALTSACAPRSSIVKSDGFGRGVALSQKVHIKDVPFFPDNTDQCGPSSLASVLSYWGKNVTPSDMKKEVYIPHLKGTLPMDMRPSIEARGLSGQVINGSFDQVKQEIRSGRPVIAYLDFGTRRRPIGHFVVITGFDDRRKGLIIHSSMKRDKFASYRRFRRGWSDTYYWMMVVSPEAGGDVVTTTPKSGPLYWPGLNADDLYRLGHAYETNGLPLKAVAHYRMALQREKNHIPSLMAMGNYEFAGKNYRAARRYYRRVLKRDPGHGGANNNLAMVHLKEGRRLKDAAAHATTALKSPEYARYAKDTLQKIEMEKMNSTKRFTLNDSPE